MWFWWLSAALAGDDVDVAPHVRWSAIPNASYDSDDGFGLGARGQVDWLNTDYAPYRASAVVHLFVTTNGYHHHRLKFDLVGLGSAHRGRLYGHFAYRAWLNDGYWGIGNTTTLDPRALEDLERDDPERHYNRYRLIQPFGHITWRREVGGPWAFYAGTEARYSVVGVYPGSLLEAESPLGVEGGAAVQAGGGLLFDTREPEISPGRGVYLEVSGRAVGMVDTAFGGPMVVARGWVQPAAPVVLAGRVMAEYLFGEVPFYEMVHWGGFVPTAGFGGADTIRGVPYGRWRGPGKAVANGEVRIDVLRHQLAGEELRWQLVPYGDVGFVFGAGAESPSPVFHPAVGLGVRPIWGETLVGRLDVGVGWDRVVSSDGATTRHLSWGFYLVFDHLF